MAHPTPTQIVTAIIGEIIADDRECEKTGERHLPARVIALVERAVSKACANA